MQIPALCLAFLVSGASALLFETLWLRLCGLVFGNAVVSVALILSSFMTGLALGGAIAAFGLLSKRRPLLSYALLELGIGVLGFAIVFLIPNVGTFTHPLFRLLSQHEIAIDVARFGGSFVILALPATAMGLTLPVAISDRVFEHHKFRRALAIFYGCNTLGAVIGTLSGEGYLIRAFGVGGTALTAAALNLFAAAIAFGMLRLDRQSFHLPPRGGLRFQWSQCRRVHRFLIVTFGTGALLLSLEVVWFRFLRLYIASTATAFAIMLAVVLAGIALGAIASAFFRHEVSAKGRKILANLLLVAAIATLATYVFFPMSILQRFAASWHDFVIDTWKEIAIVSFALMFPTAFVSGMLFPLTVDAIEAEVSDRTNSVGIAALLNTSGAAAGPLVTSFVLLPAFGFQTALILCALGYALLATLLVQWPRFSDWRSNNVTAGLMVVFAAALILFPYRRNESHFAHARQPFEADGSRLVSKREGNSDTWQLLRRDLFGQPYYCRLLTNAFSMSSTQYPNQRYMRLFAYLPLTLQPRSEQALLICYGCGVTADALTQDRQLRHIDIVDLSKEVLDLADYYPGPNPLRDPRVTTFVQDGRFFLQATTRKYDVITGEPPPPKVAGTVNIYTQEFFQLMHDALNDGGIATFWLPIYQLKVDETKAILRAFHN
ncbi:MAG: spermidine synthase, partial [Verrucomicrobiota bacterium]